MTWLVVFSTMGSDSIDSRQHNFSETPVFAGCGVRAGGTNESNTYRRTQRKNTVFRSSNQVVHGVPNGSP